MCIILRLIFVVGAELLPRGENPVSVQDRSKLPFFWDCTKKALTVVDNSERCNDNQELIQDGFKSSRQKSNCC
ncbi:Uncharacterised protein [Vibrio cholerae]|uniref:Uncharacterized protein n=1 Tax=Vibrio cholerae TaxID=666 RepID=A0A656AUH0_VIBCL|nr:Uncharacterised protein [Vibrio cholerae]